jgi:hypothetical protein
VSKKVKIEVTGDNKAAEHFLSWLCGQGEQDYWLWMEYREQEEDGDITITSFKYDFSTGEIVGNLGRMDEGWNSV